MVVPSQRRRATVRERRVATERLILDATESLLENRSFHDITVEDVMVSIGLGRTAFYRYFTDLEAVLLRRLSELTDLVAEAAGLWFDRRADPVVSLLDGARALATLYEEHGRLLLALSDAAATGPEVQTAWRGMVQGFVRPTLERVEQLRADGLCTIEHPGETSRALVWMIERYLLETYGRGEPVPIETAAETIAQIWRRTLFGGDASPYTALSPNHPQKAVNIPREIP